MIIVLIAPVVAPFDVLLGTTLTVALVELLVTVILVVILIAAPVRLAGLAVVVALVAVVTSMLVRFILSVQFIGYEKQETAEQFAGSSIEIDSLLVLLTASVETGITSSWQRCMSTLGAGKPVAVHVALKLRPTTALLTFRTTESKSGYTIITRFIRY